MPENMDMMTDRNKQLHSIRSVIFIHYCAAHGTLLYLPFFLLFSFVSLRGRGHSVIIFAHSVLFIVFLAQLKATVLFFL